MIWLYSFLLTFQADSSDEEVNKLNKVAHQVSEFKSIKSLAEKQKYKVLKFEIVETVNGKTVRIQLEDEDMDSGFFYVHLPKRFLPAVEANLTKYRAITSSKNHFILHTLGKRVGLSRLYSHEILINSCKCLIKIILFK